MITPIVPAHPLSARGVVKIALGRAASDALKGLGKHVLVFATEADSTAPAEAQGRMVLNCLPIMKDRADAAYRVAVGTHRAMKLKPAKP